MIEHLLPVEQTQTDQQGDNGASTENTTEGKARRKFSKAPGGRRTKTGCLTCRRRRVKCTEEKPACQNCTKAKRECGGYLQEIKFKDPMTNNATPWAASQVSFIVQKNDAEPSPASASSLSNTNTRCAAPSAARNDVLVFEVHTSFHGSQKKEGPDSPAHGSGQYVAEPDTRSNRVAMCAMPFVVETPSTQFLEQPVSKDSATRQHVATGLAWDPRMTCALESREATSPASPQASTISTREKVSALDDDRMMDDEDSDVDPTAMSHDYRSKANEVSYIMATHSRHDSLQVRTYRSFINTPNMLASYIPTSSTLPLQDPTAARIFCHFINVTGPSMSMFDRHPANPLLLFNKGPVPKSRQHLWTYTLPALALQSQALLQAILAVGSLHISHLQNESLTASLKHYSFALRRIAKAVGSPRRRVQPATLAAAIILAYYEIWTADHAKWINHLLGATQLIKELDFSGIVQYIRRRPPPLANAEALGSRFDDSFYQDQHLTMKDVDANLVSMLMGKKLRYNESGMVIDDEPAFQDNRQYTEAEVDNLEIQADLWWSYVKQDVYQSILGGGALFLSYGMWSNCPPRAPLGRINATFGTFDHLILVMGRLGDFTARDAYRKRALVRANGGMWRPPGMPRPTNMKADLSKIQASMPPMPDFDGMMPGMTEPKLPRGFTESRSPPRTMPTYSEGIELDQAGTDAVEEWQEIRNAFAVFAEALGEEFQPLSSEYCTPIISPFGPALQYRTYAIAGIWLNYYLALIACHRAHPSMPPAATMAVNVAAAQTAPFAGELGRIAAGIAPGCHKKVEVPPAIGAALIESATPLFVAGVQFDDPVQREWTIQRLHDVARLTGFQTATAIASGCEASWSKRAEYGRGPPYLRTTQQYPLADIAHIRRLDRTFEALGDGKLVVKSGHRAHFALGLLGMPEDFQRMTLQDDML